MASPHPTLLPVIPEHVEFDKPSSPEQFSFGFQEQKRKEEDDDGDVFLASSSLRPYEDSLDELQALNTALCFLCSINADGSEVEGFLLTHPAALLLEGAGNLPEESAHAITEEQIRKCSCFSPACTQNRIQVLAVMDRGFAYYQTRNLRERPPKDTSWRLVYGEKMRALEHDIREWRLQELSLRHRLLELAMEVRTIQEQLLFHTSSDGTSHHHHHHREAFPSAFFSSFRQNSNPLLPHDHKTSSTDDNNNNKNYNNNNNNDSKKSPLALLTNCSHALLRAASNNYNPTNNNSELFARRSVLEYQVGIAQLTLQKIEREHREILRKIRSARRLQFGLLKTAFDGCRRHVCLTGA